MNSLIRTLSTLVLVLSIVSCKKDKDDPKPIKTRLSKLIQWNNATPSKGIITTEFVYDDEKRVKEINYYAGDSTGSEIKNTKQRSITYYYNGNEKEPYKSIGGIIGEAGPETFYFYNNGNLVRDSSLPTQIYNRTVVKKYSYNSAKIIILKETYNGTNIVSWDLDSCMTANHNLTETYTFYSYPQGNGYKYNYDDKVNPLSKMNIAITMVKNSPLGFPSYLAPGYCQNNMTVFTYGTSAGPGVFTPSTLYNDNTYFYDDNNLPVECRVSSTSIKLTIKLDYIE
ncbi:hypothetical protein [Niastella sp. OAS944]|uniref:hypothetical protein n=1 Tax=Niastella sp. OAS944 TaxID=2664089 RepID=UPI00348749BA|nr:hypothetical protein [Chitinophagaceae bacterium OAS944]